MRFYRVSRLVLLCSFLFLLPLACGDDNGGGSTGPDPTGSLEVTLTFAGNALDADGCLFTVDGAGQRRLAGGESTTYTALSVGQHEVAISDVAGNCQVLGEAARTVAVTADQTATTTFAVTCAEDVGGIHVSVTTGGEDLDADGYEVVVDGGAPTAIGINGSMTAGGLAPGDYSVELQGEAFNCDVAGNNPRTVTATAGQETQVTFDVTCRFHLYDRIAFQSDRSGASMLYAVYPYDPAAGVRSLGLEGKHPAVSPDGLLISYSFQDDIWVARADGSAPFRITDTAANDRSPAWSPDGGWIAFTRDTEVWTMHADGSVQSRLTDGADPTWSPDGGRIAYVEDHNFGDITLVDADGGNEFNLVQSLAPDNSPTWSPLGNYIGFVSPRDGGLLNHVFVVEPTGGVEINMTIALIGTASAPTWAPAAVAGAFASDDLGTFDIYYFVPGSPDVVRLTTDPANDHHPSWGGGN